MGKRIRLREARRREAELRFGAVLEAHSRFEARPRASVCFIDFKSGYRERIEALRSHALRPPEDWRCRIKSRLEERRFIDLVRFTFARFHVAPHLERLWIDEVEDDFVDRVVLPNRQTMRRPGAPDLHRWYLVAAQGGSLYKEEARLYLSKQETHHFLTAPPEITATKQAFWYAVARAQAGNVEVARKVARCKVANHSIASTYWKEVARFFARNPCSVTEMNDLADFLLAAKQEDPDFTLKGRTASALKRRMEDWHFALRRNHAIRGGVWVGSPLSDVELRNRPRRQTRGLAHPADQDRRRALSRGRAHAPLCRELQAGVHARRRLNLVDDVRIPDRAGEPRRHHGGHQGWPHRAVSRLRQPSSARQRGDDGKALGAGTLADMGAARTVTRSARQLQRHYSAIRRPSSADQ